MKKMSKKKKILLCIAVVLVLAIGAYVVVSMSGDKIVIFDGVASVTLPKGMSQTFQRTLGDPNPGVAIDSSSSFFLAAPYNEAITRFTITPAGRFVMPTDIKDYLLASGLLPHIDEVKNQKVTSRKNGTTISATVTNNRAIDFPTYQFVLNVVVGKNYAVTSITQIHEKNIDTTGSRKWLSYMSSLKMLDDEKVAVDTAKILPENLKEIAMKSTSSPVKEFPIEGYNTSIFVRLPESFTMLYKDGAMLGLLSGDEKYSADLFISEGTSLEDFLYLADYDFYVQKFVQEDYIDVTRSPTIIIEKDYNDTHYFKVNYTYEVTIDGEVVRRDCSQIIAATQIAEDTVYAMIIGFFTDEDIGLSDRQLIDTFSDFR